MFTAFEHVPTRASKRPLVDKAASSSPRKLQASAQSGSEPLPREPLLPFVAQEAGGFRERFASISDAAFRERRQCTDHAERPLHTLLVGHNPSDHSWASGAPYSQPSNRFWTLLRESGVLPAGWRAGAAPTTLANNMAGELGLGITDFFLAPGSDAQAFGRERMCRERGGFYARLSAHVRRAGAAPRIVAFVGKRQWAQCFEPPLKSVPGVRQPRALRPPSWPLPAVCDVFVLTSPSGRAVVSAEERLAEYAQLAEAMHATSWQV